LISSLCVYAKINNLGFISTPYRPVNTGKVDTSGDNIIYLTAEEEDSKVIAQANAPVDEAGNFTGGRIKARFEGDFPIVEPEELHLIDVAPNQIASIAASLIPFLEHDDANRALMGSNMQRQAVPLLRPQAPIVGTGLEGVVRDSRVLINADYAGVWSMWMRMKFMCVISVTKTRNSSALMMMYVFINSPNFRKPIRIPVST
jgi:DNA-directed RNA polymerase subunit beta